MVRFTPLRICLVLLTLIGTYVFLNSASKFSGILDYYGDFKEPLLEPIEEPEGILTHLDDKRPLANATIVSLVRNNELDAMLQSIKELESTFNSKFHYPWLFINDVPFTNHFKKMISKAVSGKARFEIVPPEHWDIPEWVDRDVMELANDLLDQKDVQYAKLESYHQMCRWNSGFFYKHPALQDVKYYWRVEPGVHFFCDVDYDVFHYMEDNDKTYGFVLTIYDDPKTIPTLWAHAKDFIKHNPDYLHPNNSMPWLTNKARVDHNLMTGGYSTCHFWSNFEIASLDFWRSEVYEDFFHHLDRTGGFFYERWGDAPFHSIALALFEDKSKVHWFKDIGYNHIPFYNCPNSNKCSGCDTGVFYQGEPFLQREDCRKEWFKVAGMG